MCLDGGSRGEPGAGRAGGGSRVAAPPRRLAHIRRAEDKLRTQLIENEELNLKLQKERESHKSIGDQTLSQTEQITALQGEVERLKKLSETTLRDRDVKVEVAKAEAAVAESQTADAAFVALWKQLSREMPEAFTETRVPPP